MSRLAIADGPQSPDHASRVELDAILRVCSSLTAPKSLPEILDSLLTETRAVLHADAGAIYLVDGERIRFVTRQAGERCAADHRVVSAGLARRIGLPPSEARPDSAAAEVARSGTPLNIVDIYHLPADSPIRRQMPESVAGAVRCVSILAAPMIDREGRVVGVIELFNHRAENGDLTPFSARDEEKLGSLAAVAAVAVSNAELHEQLHRSQLDTILRLASAAEFRDGDTGHHIRRMSCYCEAVARAMGRTPEWCRLILFASPMHDVGKLGIPDAILRKPGPLTLDERSLMQRHTLIGAELLRGSDNEILIMAERIAVSHHEMWDGTGYPRGLAGEAIPVEGRIAAIADVFDALTNARVYKPAFSFEDAFRMIVAQSGGHFDPQVAAAFHHARDEIESIYEAYRE